MERGLIAANPTRGYKTPKVESRATYLTPEQEADMLAAANRALRIALKV